MGCTVEKAKLGLIKKRQMGVCIYIVYINQHYSRGNVLMKKFDKMEYQ